jgi:hypothetical protein
VTCPHRRPGLVGLSDEDCGECCHTTSEVPDLVDPSQSVLVRRGSAIDPPESLEQRTDLLEGAVGS